MIHNGERNSLVTEFPTAHLRFEEQLHTLGVWNPQGDIFPRDNEDEAIRVKLWSDDAFGNLYEAVNDKKFNEKFKAIVEKIV